jgi:hypothetical protein
MMMLVGSEARTSVRTIAHHARQVARLALHGLRAAETQDLAHEMAAALDPVDDLAQVVALGVADATQGELDMPHDAREQVVEVVGDAVGERADRLLLLRLALSALAVEAGGRVGDRREREPDPATSARDADPHRRGTRCRRGAYRADRARAHRSRGRRLDVAVTQADMRAAIAPREQQLHRLPEEFLARPPEHALDLAVHEQQPPLRVDREDPRRRHVGRESEEIILRGLLGHGAASGMGCDGRGDAP